MSGALSIDSAGLKVGRHHDALHVVGLVLTMEVLTYWSYFVGLTVVNGDVNAHYMSDSFYWWNHGGILHPPKWIPYTWMGRPAGSNLQDGSYVLPQGIANAISPWSPTVSALTAAILAGVGAVGMYVLVRRLLGNHFAALIAMVAQFYAPGIFANAQFLDIQRGATYLPWLLLVASPLWFWRRRWGLPLAAVILWQVVVGIYPGQLIGGAVCVGLWFVSWVLLGGRASWSWTWRLLLAAAVALMLSAVKLAPALLGGTGQRGWEEQRILLSPSILASVFFPYNNPAMAWDVALRPFFIVIPVLLLALVATWRSRHLLPAIVLGSAAAILILLVQFAPNLLWSLPGMDLSRIQINDYRGYMIASIILLGASGAQRLAEGNVTPRSTLVAGGVICVAAAGLSTTLDWSGGLVQKVELFLPFAWIVCVTGVVHRLSLRGRGAGGLSALQLCVVGLAVASGLGFAYTVTSPWASSKTHVEQAYYQSSFNQLASGERCKIPTDRRPSRTAPSTAATDYWHDIPALAAAYDCSLAISGYANIPGNPVLRDQAQAFIDDRSGSLLKFFEAPGAISPVGDSGRVLAVDLSDSCLVGGKCDGLTFTPISYDPNGHFSYRVVVDHPLTALLNESYYQGWSGRLCNPEGICRDALPRAGEAHAIEVTLPQGMWTLDLSYRVPGAAWLRMFFWLAVVMAGALSLIPGSGLPPYVSTKRRGRRECNDAQAVPICSASPPGHDPNPGGASDALPLP